MALTVDTSDAPLVLTYRTVGPWPTLEEQAETRERLIASRQLTERSTALIDIRQLEDMPTDEALVRAVTAGLQRGGWPLKRAFLVDGAQHEAWAAQVHVLAPHTLRIGVFQTGQLALEWSHSAP